MLSTTSINIIVTTTCAIWWYMCRCHDDDYLWPYLRDCSVVGYELQAGSSKSRKRIVAFFTTIGLVKARSRQSETKTKIMLQSLTNKAGMLQIKTLCCKNNDRSADLWSLIWKVRDSKQTQKMQPQQLIVFNNDIRQSSKRCFIFCCCLTLLMTVLRLFTLAFLASWAAKPLPFLPYYNISFAKSGFVLGINAHINWTAVAMATRVSLRHFDG